MSISSTPAPVRALAPLTARPTAPAPKPASPARASAAPSASADGMGATLAGSLVGGMGTWLVAGATGLVRANPLVAGGVTLAGLLGGALLGDKLAAAAQRLSVVRHPVLAGSAGAIAGGATLTAFAMTDGLAALACGGVWGAVGAAAAFGAIAIAHVWGSFKGEGGF